MNGEDLKKIVSFTGFGFASGLPYVLVFITLTAWLRDVDIDLSLIGFFGWITLTYSLKFLWAPFVDRFSIPFFDFFGSRRSWILLMQIIIFVSLMSRQQGHSSCVWHRHLGSFSRVWRHSCHEAGWHHPSWVC